MRAQAKAKAIVPHQESLLLAFLHVDKVKIYTLQCDIWPQLWMTVTDTIVEEACLPAPVE